MLFKKLKEKQFFYYENKKLKIEYRKREVLFLCHFLYK